MVSWESKVAKIIIIIIIIKKEIETILLLKAVD
jgi:hypothetical protein